MLKSYLAWSVSRMVFPKLGKTAYWPCSLYLLNTLSSIGRFEELGNSDEFETATLEWRLSNIGSILFTSLLSVN